MPKDYYKTLGVEKSASQEEIKKAYRKAAHKFHPDKPDGDEARFKEINEAFQVVGNEEKRQQYDQFGADFDQQGGFGGGVGWEDFMRAARGQNGFSGNINFGGIDLGDIFGDIFGGGGGGRGSQRVKRGRDIQVDVQMDLVDVLQEQEKELKLRKKCSCDVCSGSGAEPGTNKKTCSTCNGQGQVEQVQRTILGNMRTAAVCHECHGEGEVPEKKCEHCRGTGVENREDEIKIKIPAGISHGEMIRSTGHGEAVQGGQPGDLYVRVHVRTPKNFERDRVDLYTRADITFAQATLGDKIQIETLDGPVKLVVPSGTQPGQNIRLKGYGVPALDQANNRGHLYVKMGVEVPKKLSRKQRKLMEELKELD
jgi:molecular chaperone DnaJ